MEITVLDQLFVNSTLDGKRAQSTLSEFLLMYIRKWSLVSKRRYCTAEAYWMNSHLRHYSTRVASGYLSILKSDSDRYTQNSPNIKEFGGFRNRTSLRYGDTYLVGLITAGRSSKSSINTYPRRSLTLLTKQLHTQVYRWNRTSKRPIKVRIDGG